MVQLLLIISTAFRGAPSKSTGTQIASMCLHERTGAFDVSSYQLGTRLFNAITRVGLKSICVLKKGQLNW